MVRKLQQISKERGLEPHDPKNPYYTRSSNTKAVSPVVRPKADVSPDAKAGETAGIARSAKPAGGSAIEPNRAAIETLGNKPTAKPVESVKPIIRGTGAAAGDAIVKLATKLGPLSLVGDAAMIHKMAQEIQFLTGHFDKGNKLPVGSTHEDFWGNVWQKTGSGRWINTTAIKTNGA